MKSRLTPQSQINIEIDIEHLVKFYDEKEKDAPKKPASSITGIIGEDLISGLYKHYIENYKKEGKVTILQGNPKNGKWLDRWMVQENESQIICYQTEIKNWSAHSLGGVSFHNLNDAEIKKKAINIFNDTFQNGDLKDPSVGKVLNDMKDKNIIEEYGVERIRPLVCFWMPICKDGEELNPFFEIKIEVNSKNNTGRFTVLSFFSASIYLRALLNEKKYSDKKNIISIEAPNIYERLNHLNNLVNIPNKK